MVEFGRDSVEVVLGEAAQVSVLVQILAQQPVGVLVGAALPGMVVVSQDIGDTALQRCSDPTESKFRARAAPQPSECS